MSTQGEKLATDVNNLVQDAEDLIKATAAETGDKVVALRSRMQRSVGDVKAVLEKMETAVIDKVKPAATAADEYVRAHPWESIGVSALAGLLIGLLVSRR